MRLTPVLALSAILALPVTVAAADPSPAPPSPDTVWSAALRYRLEQVQQTGFGHDALASTARLRLGVKHRLAASVQAFVEGEATWAMNDRFDSGANGRITYPSVTDPTAVEINQIGLMWQGEHAQATVGRQRLQFDNQRFIGNSGWRQNEQTIDAALIAFQPSPRWSLHYGYIDRVHRVATDRARAPLARERDVDAHLFHATVTTGIGPVTGYIYTLDVQDGAAAATWTEGLRWTGTRTTGAWRWMGTLEGARQRDHADHPLSFSHAYRSVELGVGRGRVEGKMGQEVLEGDGRTALQTPLATLHAFNGWADVFLVTPFNGLDDRYASVGGELPWAGTAPLKWTVIAHDFHPSRAGDRYGREWDASLGTTLGHGWSTLLKVADYQADAFGQDTRKVWLQVEWVR